MTAVVAQHCKLLPFGWMGVWLFFVISGYVVTLSVLRRETVSPGQGLMAFFHRRILRIVPVYYAYVGVGLIVVLISGSDINLLASLSLFGFFNNLTMIDGHGELVGWPVGHLWTISVEMQFYLGYGIALFYLSRRVLIQVLLAMLFASPLMRLVASDALASYGWNNADSAYAIYAGSFLHSDSFALGALLAIADRNGLASRIGRLLAVVGISLLATYILAYILVNHIILGATGIDNFRNIISGTLYGQYRQVFLYSAVGAASAGLVCLAATNDRLVSWLLNYQVFRRIGEISYGAYVYHAAAISGVIFFVERNYGAFDLRNSVTSRIFLFIFAYSLTILVSELSYRYFESRFRISKTYKPFPVSIRAKLFENVDN